MSERFNDLDGIGEHILAIKAARAVLRPKSTRTIKMRYSTIDRYSKSATFKTVEGARKFAKKYLGDYFDIGYSYAVSGDGVGKVTIVSGATWAELGFTG